MWQQAGGEPWMRAWTHFHTTASASHFPTHTCTKSHSLEADCLARVCGSGVGHRVDLCPSVHVVRANLLAVLEDLNPAECVRGGRAGERGEWAVVVVFWDRLWWEGGCGLKPVRLNRAGQCL